MATGVVKPKALAGFRAGERMVLPNRHTDWFCVAGEAALRCRKVKTVLSDARFAHRSRCSSTPD